MRKRFLRISVIGGILTGLLLFTGLLYAQEPRQTKPPQGAKKMQESRQAKPPQPPGAKKIWSKQTDWPAVLQKRLETLNETVAAATDDADVKRLLERADDLMDQAKASEEHPFQYGRRLRAANAMMDAADRVLLARKTGSDSDESDFRRASFVIQGGYFRIRQANYFANISGDKKSGQDVRMATRLYQRGRSAYDAGEYGRARLLGEASISVVFALEFMAQAATSDSRIHK